ncbi:MAG: DUF1343 domain-containing protein [Bacteroidetes bacterium]|nr:DUF1343 domain-containing protein [Bacteroidota bacterium]
MRTIFLLVLFFICRPELFAQKTIPSRKNSTAPQIESGAAQIDSYLPLLKEKRVGIFANQTSLVGNKHLVDTLLNLGIDIRVIFGPEHGFRGTADAGEKVGDFVDKVTGIPIVSLYGSKHGPDKKDLEEVDILVFDIQDVGVRFYTFISSLDAYMESAIRYNKPLLILDRPNPNGFYVDGPVLNPAYKSFIGMQPIPIVYGMTIGEYAWMLLGERWIKIEKQQEESLSTMEAQPALAQAATVTVDKIDNSKPLILCHNSSWDSELINKEAFQLIIVCCKNYDHQSNYVLPVSPSPNLPNMQSIYLYPTTCLFEGTVLSEGRGTNKPFQLIGHPALPKGMVQFTPNPNVGAKKSKHFGVVCYGWDFGGTPTQVLSKTNKKIQLNWILEAYKIFPQKDSFFLLPKSGDSANSFFNKLAGNNTLMQQIKDGKDQQEIRLSWEPQLAQFKATRKRYLLYKDFE